MATEPERRWTELDAGPDYLDADMTPADMIDILGRLKFRDGKAVLQVDRAARDDIVTAVAARRGK